MCSDPGPAPDDFTPKAPPRLAFIVEQTDILRTTMMMHRRIPARDAEIRMQLIELERMSCWYPDFVPVRGRRAVETAMLATMKFMRHNRFSPQDIVTALPTLIIGARAASEAYEAVGMPGVLQGLARVESCFEESDGHILLVATNAELIMSCIELVTALRMQGVPPHHDASETNADTAPGPEPA